MAVVPHNRRAPTFEPVKTKWTEKKIQLLLVNDYRGIFPKRRYLCVPNVSWGMIHYEADLVAVSPAGLASEVEIKISKSDLEKDFSKRHLHNSRLFAYLYYAGPVELQEHFERLCPDTAGIILVAEDKRGYQKPWIHRTAKEIRPYRFTTADRAQLARLGTLRYWNQLNKALA